MTLLVERLDLPLLVANDSLGEPTDTIVILIRLNKVDRLCVSNTASKLKIKHWFPNEKKILSNVAYVCRE